MDLKKAHYVASTAIIIKDGKFLITKRSPNEKAFPNKWTVPGGRIETGDYINAPMSTINQWYSVLENSLRREVMEEVGLEIKNIRYLTNLAFIRPDNIPVIVLSFYADYDGDDVKLSDEMTDYAWVTLNEAKKYDFIEGIYEELVMLDKILRGENPGEWKKES